MGPPRSRTWPCGGLSPLASFLPTPWHQPTCGPCAWASGHRAGLRRGLRCVRSCHTCGCRRHFWPPHAVTLIGVARLKFLVARPPATFVVAWGIWLVFFSHACVSWGSVSSIGRVRGALFTGNDVSGSLLRAPTRVATISLTVVRVQGGSESVMRRSRIESMRWSIIPSGSSPMGRGGGGCVLGCPMPPVASCKSNEGAAEAPQVRLSGGTDPQVTIS